MLYLSFGFCYVFSKIGYIVIVFKIIGNDNMLCDKMGIG